MSKHVIAFLFALTCTTTITLGLGRFGVPSLAQFAVAAVLFPAIAWAHLGVLRSAEEDRHG